MDRHYAKIQWENYPSTKTAVNATNLGKVDIGVYTIDGIVINHDAQITTNTGNIATNTSDIATLNTTKANEQDYQTAITGVDYNTKTGVWTFTQRNGTTFQFDQNVEKVPVNFSMSDKGVLTMETADGTKYTADIGSMIKQYTFANSDTVSLTTTTDAKGNKSIKAEIVGHSIGADQLETNYLADCQQSVTASSNNATISENKSKDSEAWATGEKDNIPVSSTEPQYHNNAKYYADKAKGIVSSGAVPITYEAWKALPDKENDNTTYIITDLTVNVTASSVEFDDTETQLDANNVQDAIAKVAEKIGSDAFHDTKPVSPHTSNLKYIKMGKLVFVNGNIVIGKDLPANTKHYLVTDLPHFSDSTQVSKKINGTVCNYVGKQLVKVGDVDLWLSSDNGMITLDNSPTELSNGSVIVLDFSYVSNENIV